MDDVDINKAFDDICFSEEKVGEVAFEEGVLKGQEIGIREGYHLGYHKGAQIGLEVAYYRTILSGIVVDKDSKLYARGEVAQTKLRNSLEVFKNENNSDRDVLKDLEATRACFKQLASIFKIATTPEFLKSNNSF